MTHTKPVRVCGTARYVWVTPGIQLPGHEVFGVVAELGYGSTGLTVGQRVSGPWTDKRAGSHFPIRQPNAGRRGGFHATGDWRRER
jgi:threonine dehydrogenase-like Zn-dependent dehydrogenase